MTAVDKDLWMPVTYDDHNALREVFYALHVEDQDLFKTCLGLFKISVEAATGSHTVTMKQGSYA